jgi:Type ISP C-terminal specificity domain
LDRLKAAYGYKVNAEDLFAYAYAVLANPGYVEMFWEELSTPGPRLPLTKNAALFDKAVNLGCKLIWLHTFGNRMVQKRKRAGEVPQGKARCLKAIPQAKAAYPEEFSYNAVSREIQFGGGLFGPVAPEVWESEVSGLKVVQSWLAYRRRSGAGKWSSTLDEIRPILWTAQLTDQFLQMLWVLEHTVALYPDLQRLLEEIVEGDCLLASGLPQPTAAEREAPQVPGQRQARDTRQEVMNFGAED